MHICVKEKRVKMLYNIQLCSIFVLNLLLANQNHCKL